MSGLEVWVVRRAKSGASRVPKGGRTRIGKLPPLSQTLLLKPGDRLILQRESYSGGRPPVARREKWSLRQGLEFLCRKYSITPNRANSSGLTMARSAVYFAPWTQILQRLRSRKHVPKGKTLAAEKGINLPDTRIDIPALTPEDLEALKFIVEHADLVGYSFVRTESDVRELLDRLEELGGQNLGLILKIETRKAFDNLPELILASMRTRSLAS